MSPEEAIKVISNLVAYLKLRDLYIIKLIYNYLKKS